MKKFDLAKKALVNSLGVAAYVFLVAVFMQNANRLFGKADSMFSGMAAMLLLVFSAALTGSLVFGKTVLMYLDNAKKEAVWLLGYTLAWLFAWLVLSFLLVAAIR
jgi:hypothetical protein